MANKWLKQLKAYDDSVDYTYDSFAKENCLYTPSPYFNWIFANKSHGVPKNATILMLSEQKAGKSLSCYAMILEMQRRDPEGIAIYFNTELRGALQYDIFPEIDKDRMIIYDTKDPVEIFDRIENDIKAMVQDGMPLRMIVIDSLTNIQGIKRRDAASVEDHLRGDHALTIQTGLDKLVPFCKRNKILLIGTSQMRAEQNSRPGGPSDRMAEGWITKHTFEYFISLKRAGSAEDQNRHVCERDKIFKSMLCNPSFSHSIGRSTGTKFCSQAFGSYQSKASCCVCKREPIYPNQFEWSKRGLRANGLLPRPHHAS